ncbi:MAG: hypothetical protein MUF87_04500 [Anaerolineae bacterium]|jgi:hypothetical protein|nr:hypothetical protein [Anaerolineae bacterium]
MTVDHYGQLESIANELMKEFDIKVAPVPVESMLRDPKPGMWSSMNLNQLTGSFFSIRDQYSPRMSMARLIARLLINTEWGQQRELSKLITDEDSLRAFARMVIMPKSLLQTLSSGAKNAVTIRMNFEVPEEDAQQRLLEIL